MLRKIFLIFTTLVVVGTALYVVNDLSKADMLSKKVEDKLSAKIDSIKNIGSELATKNKEKVLNYIHELAYKLVDDTFKRIEFNVIPN